MKLFKSTFPFSALAIIFIILGIVLRDPRPFSFGIVWLIIAAAKHLLTSRKEKIKGSN